MPWNAVTNLRGPPGVSAYTVNAANFTVPALGASVTVEVEEADSFAVGQWVWVEGAAGGGNAAIMQVTAISGNDMTLLNPA